MTLKDEILAVIKNLKSLHSLITSLKSQNNLYDRILNSTPFLNKFQNVRTSERVYCIIYDLVDRQKCKECGKNYVNYISFNIGYVKFCSHTCGSINRETKLKNKETNLTKYGKQWFMQTTRFKKESKITLLKNYNVTNYSKTNEFRETINKITLSRTKEEIDQITKKGKESKRKNHGDENFNNRKKFKQTMMDRYGVETSFRLSNRYYSKISQNLFWNLYKELPENLKVSTYFAELPKNEYRMIDLNNDSIYIDFTILDIKFCIEFFGDIYHGNPNIFNENDKPNFFYKNLTCKQIWEKDKKRINFIEDNGFKILIIWEEEYLKRKNEVVNRCLEVIKIQSDFK